MNKMSSFTRRVIKMVKAPFSSNARVSILRHLYSHEIAKRRFAKKRHFTFVDRQKGSKDLVLLVAGFQPYFWDIGLENIQIASSKIDADVCICIPKGGNDAGRLLEFANKFGWSVLWLKDDLLAQAQNDAIRLHSKAERIYKLDEDIMIGEDYFLDMQEAYRLSADSDYDAGLIVPILNINLATMLDFVNSLGIREDFDACFGTKKIGDTFYWSSEDVASYLQQPVLQKGLSAVCDVIRKKNAGVIKPIPCRYSIGAILFSRCVWEEMGGFEVHEVGALAMEEEQVNSWTQLHSKPIICAMNVFASHMGYFPTKGICKQLFEGCPSAFAAKRN